jgi:hypothetical protein
MTLITLKNGINSSQLSVLLGLFDSWNVEAEVTEEKITEKKNFLQLFSKTRGMWKDYDINGIKLRNEAWGINDHLEI